MKVAHKLIFLTNDSRGFGKAIANSLHPLHDSPLTKSESTFELPLDSYGIVDVKASGNLINFVDQHHSPQVSILCLENYKTPVAACAVNEVLRCITEASTDPPSFILPAFITPSKVKHINKLPETAQADAVVYAVELGESTPFTRVLVDGLKHPPSHMTVQNEPMSCLVHFLRVLKLPSVLLAAPANQVARYSDEEKEVVCRIGEILALHCSLSFSREKISQSLIGEKMKVPAESWRSFYQ